MAEILVVDKLVAPNASWTQLVLNYSDENISPCAYKVIFDRTYPYIWVKADYAEMPHYGLALTYVDVQRAAVFDEETGEFKKFNVFTDGVMPLMGNMAFGIAMGPRQAFYLLSNQAYCASVGRRDFYISAQDVPVCPFASVNPWET